jgi:hypothetical protein
MLSHPSKEKRKREREMHIYQLGMFEGHRAEYTA